MQFFSVNGQEQEIIGDNPAQTKNKSVREYGSFSSWIENEFLLPYLKIGGTRRDFWELTPHDIQLDFKAYQERMEDESNRMVQSAWAIGLYVRAALASTPVIMGYSKHSPPKYPDLPQIKKNDENYTEKAKDEAWVEKERQRAWDFFANLGKK